MPEYKLTQAAWLKREVGRVIPPLKDFLDANLKYTLIDIQQFLQDQDLIYTTEQAEDILAQLVLEGILEEV